jgi:hypothetical protein
MTTLLVLFGIYTLLFIFGGIGYLHAKKTKGALLVVNLTNVLFGGTLASIWFFTETDGFSQGIGAMLIGGLGVILSVVSISYYWASCKNVR